MPNDVPAEEIAARALAAADEAASAVMDRIRAESRRQALSLVLGERQYRAGAEIARNLDYPEGVIHDLVCEVAAIHGDDSYMAAEDVFGLDLRLLD